MKSQMKKLLTSLLVTLGLSSFGQENSNPTTQTTIDCKALKEKKGVWLFNKKPYTGVCQTKYTDGNIESESNFTNGLINGKVKMYYQNGNLQESTEYKMGIPNGIVNYYFEEGELSESGKVTYGQKTGEWKSYLKNGKLKSIENYIKGEMNGPVKSYAENGNIEIEGQFINGKQEGKWTFYNTETGEIDGTIKYKNGEPIKE